MFYEVFAALCYGKAISPSKAAADIGIDRSNVTQWKKRGLTPRGEALQKIADYFGVTVDYLLGGTQKTPYAANLQDELVALYGAAKPHLAQSDIDDIALFIKMKTERARQKEANK